MEEFFKLISTYGLAVVIAGTVIWFAIRFGLVRLEDYEQERLNKKHDELTQIRSQVGATINALLERSMLKTRACRAYVVEFHNGTVSMGGLPFLKMSCVYETLGEGAKSEAHRRENMSLQLYSTFFDSICSRDYLILDVNDRDLALASTLTYETLAELGVAATIRAKITDSNKKVIGYFGIDYGGEGPVDIQAVRGSAEIVQSAAVELGALLSVNEKEQAPHVIQVNRSRS